MILHGFDLGIIIPMAADFEGGGWRKESSLHSCEKDDDYGQSLRSWLLLQVKFVPTSGNREIEIYKRGGVF